MSTLNPGHVEVVPVEPEHALSLADLINAIIERGGTTAFERPFTVDELASAYLTGGEVHCCFVAVDSASRAVAGFQTLVRTPALSAGIGDIGTFARVDNAQRGIGSALFAATQARAQQLGLAAINATIRADNAGGLVFYSRLGFVDHSVTRAVPLLDGTPMDRVNKRFALDVLNDGALAQLTKSPVVTCTPLVQN